jgi:energy-coupling factor transporter ATP-binding protein EcfA2
LAEPIVECKNITFKYRHGEDFAIKNISFTIEKGDFVIVMGYSGCGKSTLLKAINGLVPNFYPGSYGGKVTTLGIETTEIETAKLADRVGFVFQNPENQLSNLTVEQEIAFPLENFGYPREQMKKRIDEIISLLNLESIRYKSPFKISGGEQQLTAIGAALALDPPILILDEVTAHLSPQKSQEILQLLHQLNTEYQKTIILSEHRLDRMLSYATKLIFMEKGSLMAIGKPRELIKQGKIPVELMPKLPRLFQKFVDSYSSIEPKTKATLESLDFTTPLTNKEFLGNLRKIERTMGKDK